MKSMRHQERQQRRVVTAPVSRHRFLRAVVATAGLGAIGRLPVGIAAPPGGAEGAVRVRRGLGRPAAGRGGALDPPGARPAERAAGWRRTPVEVQWEVARTRGWSGSCSRGTTIARPELATRPRRRQRARARAVVLLPLPGRRRGQPGRPHPDRARRRRRRSTASLRLRLLPALRERLLHRLPRTGRARTSTWWCTWATTSTSAARHGDGRRVRHARRPGADRRSSDYRNRHALYKTRPRPAGGPRRLPLDRDLGRPRGGEQLRRADRRGRQPGRPGVPAPAGRPPTRPTTSTCRCAGSRCPAGPTCSSTARFAFGDLADVPASSTPASTAPTSPAATATQPAAPARSTRGRTLLGADAGALAARRPGASRAARWNVIAQQVMMAPVDLTAGDGAALLAWTSGTATPPARTGCCASSASGGSRNPVVITGDIHSNWVNDLKLTGRPTRRSWRPSSSAPRSPRAATGRTCRRRSRRTCRRTRRLRFYNGQRGYVLNTLTGARWQADYRIVPVVTSPGGAVSTRATFVVENGRPGAVSA